MSVDVNCPLAKDIKNKRGTPGLEGYVGEFLVFERFSCCRAPHLIYRDSPFAKYVSEFTLSFAFVDIVSTQPYTQMLFDFSHMGGYNGAFQNDGYGTWPNIGAIQKHAWHSFIVVYDKPNMSFYFNGTKIFTYTPNWTTDCYLGIGYSPRYGREFQGYMRNVQISEAALSQADVQRCHNSLLEGGNYPIITGNHILK